MEVQSVAEGFADHSAPPLNILNDSDFTDSDIP
jgi:hypothetical protein